MTNKMKCVKLLAPNELKYITDEDKPVLPQEGAIVKVLYCGMCHSDAHLWRGTGTFPSILGHEVSGEIESIGPTAANPEGLTVGDKVAVYPWFGCVNCKACNAGCCSYCESGADKLKYIGVNQPGGYGEYVAVPKLQYLLKVPTTVPMEVAGVLGCGMLTAYNAVQTAMPYIDPVLQFRDKCGILIIGAGGLGLSAVKLLKALVLDKYDNVELVCADLQENKLALAKDTGCHEVVLWSKDDSEEDMVKGASSVFTGKGAAIVLDFVGSKQTFAVGFKTLKKRGVLINIGLHGIGIEHEIPAYDSTLASKSVCYIFTGSLQQMKELTQLAADGKVTSVPWKVYPLKDAIQLMHELEAGRIEGRAILSSL